MNEYNTICLMGQNCTPVIFAVFSATTWFFKVKFYLQKSEGLLFLPHAVVYSFGYQVWVVYWKPNRDTRCRDRSASPVCSIPTINPQQTSAQRTHKNYAHLSCIYTGYIPSFPTDHEKVAPGPQFTQHLNYFAHKIYRRSAETAGNFCTSKIPIYRNPALMYVIVMHFVNTG